jgi:hypothetical protein
MELRPKNSCTGLKFQHLSVAAIFLMLPRCSLQFRSLVGFPSKGASASMIQTNYELRVEAPELPMLVHYKLAPKCGVFTCRRRQFELLLLPNKCRHPLSLL